MKSELFSQIKNSRKVGDEILEQLEKEVKTEYSLGNWDRVIEWRDLLFDILDSAQAWEKAQLINKWAKEAAKATGRGIEIARFTHDEADILSRKGHFFEAIPLYEESFREFERLGDHPQATHSLHMLSLAKRAIGRSHEAETLTKECIYRADFYKMGSWRAHPLHNLAWLSRDKRNFKKALFYLKEAISIHEASQDHDGEVMLAQSYYDIAQIYIWLGKVNEAEKNMEIAKQWDIKAGYFEGSYKREKLLADLLMLKGETQEAIAQYHQALDSVQVGPDERRVADLYLDLSQAYLRSGDFYRAITYFKNGISQARLLGLFTNYKARLGILLQWRTLLIRQKRRSN